MLARELPGAELDSAVSLTGAPAALSTAPDVADVSLPDAEGLEVVVAPPTA